MSTVQKLVDGAEACALWLVDHVLARRPARFKARGGDLKLSGARGDAREVLDDTAEPEILDDVVGRCPNVERLRFGYGVAVSSCETACLHRSSQVFDWLTRRKISREALRSLVKMHQMSGSWMSSTLRRWTASLELLAD